MIVEVSPHEVGRKLKRSNECQFHYSFFLKYYHFSFGNQSPSAPYNQ